MSWIQEIVPFEFRGRVFSLRGMALNLAAIISYGAVGPLADGFGVSKVMFGIGVLLCVITALSSALPGYRVIYRRRPPAQAAA
jgi:MFS family permease